MLNKIILMMKSRSLSCDLREVVEQDHIDDEVKVIKL